MTETDHSWDARCGQCGWREGTWSHFGAGAVAGAHSRETGHRPITYGRSDRQLTESDGR